MGEAGYWKYGGESALVRSPHNSFLGIAFRSGIVGLFLFLLFLSKFYFYTIRNILKVGNPQLRGYAVAALAAHIAVVIQAFFNVTLEGPHEGIIFWVLIGVELRVLQLAKSKMVDQVPVSAQQRALSHSEPAPASLARISNSGGVSRMGTLASAPQCAKQHESIQNHKVLIVGASPRGIARGRSHNDWRRDYARAGRTRRREYNGGQCTRTDFRRVRTRCRPAPAPIGLTSNAPVSSATTHSVGGDR